jgi:hypothetical protein
VTITDFKIENFKFVINKHFGLDSRIIGGQIARVTQFPFAGVINLYKPVAVDFSVEEPY